MSRQPKRRAGVISHSPDPTHTTIDTLPPPPTLADSSSSKACRVFVGNLSWDVDWRALKEHMNSAGSVVRADVLMGGDGRSKGCGIVEFASEEDARTARDTLHDTEILGRKIFVREVRFDDEKGDVWGG